MISISLAPSSVRWAPGVDFSVVTLASETSGADSPAEAWTDGMALRSMKPASPHR